MTGLFALALLLVAAGTACIYLASPHQLWRPQPWRRGPARAAGALLLLGGLLAFLNELQVATATFVFAHALMLCGVSFPYLGALLASRRKAAP